MDNIDYDVELTKEQQLEREAFHAGANYIFNRLGMWYGRGHEFYKTYFEECAARGAKPNLVSMIFEEVRDISDMYVRGWREDTNEKLEPIAKSNDAS